MNSFAKKRLVAVLLGVVALGACEKNAVQDITGVLPSAKIKFLNFGVGAPSVNFYANDQKITAITSATGTEATTGVAFGGTGNAGLYSGLEPGQYTLTGKISATVDKDLAISSVQTTLADGKAYSYFISGVYNTTTKNAEAFVVEDPIPTTLSPDSAYVRFVNAIPNSTPQLVQVVNTTTSVAAPLGTQQIAYKAASAFTAVPAGTYNVQAFVPGNTTPVVLRTGVSLVGGRVYTLASRGDMTLPTTGTAANRPQFDLTANR